MEPADVIVAVATAAGRSAVGVVRLSGAYLDAYLQPLLGRRPTPRRATLTDFLDQDGTPIDTGIALYFPRPNSYTGEDVLELQGHGGSAVLGQVLARCLELGARIAQPGEFTRRAFLNGKLDLAQAESVADLIDASSERAARSAMRSLKGEFSRQIQKLAAGLIELRAWAEAGIDFPEEEIDPLAEETALAHLRELTESMRRIQEAAISGSLLREGAHVALIGRPNVGKSSLLNKLAGEEIAIVTEVPGTTRDAIRQQLVIDGVPIHIIDTAGLRQTNDPVEQIGMARTWEVLDRADVALLLIDVTVGMSPEDARILERMPSGITSIVVANKIDLADLPAAVSQQGKQVEVRTSALSGDGIDLLRAEILKAIGWHPGEEGVFLARRRHLEALERAESHLVHASSAVSQLELFAEELRLAQSRLNEITGEFLADDLLGEIFGRFCIGK
jgi:tRNA modification GTPase